MIKLYKEEDEIGEVVGGKVTTSDDVLKGILDVILCHDYLFLRSGETDGNIMIENEIKVMKGDAGYEEALVDLLEEPYFGLVYNEED